MIFGHCQKLIITLNVIKPVTTLLSLSFPFLTVVLISSIWLALLLFLQMIVIGIIMVLSFYENCYYWEIGLVLTAALACSRGLKLILLQIFSNCLTACFYIFFYFVLRVRFCYKINTYPYSVIIYCKSKHIPFYLRSSCIATSSQVPKGPPLGLATSTSYYMLFINHQLTFFYSTWLSLCGDEYMTPVYTL